MSCASSIKTIGVREEKGVGSRMEIRQNKQGKVDEKEENQAKTGKKK